MTTPVIGHPHTQNEVFKDFLNNQPAGGNHKNSCYQLTDDDYSGALTKEN